MICARGAGTKLRGLGVVALALAGAAALVTCASAQVGERGAPSAREVEQEMQRRANQERVRVGLPELKDDMHLVEAARAHSKWMAERRTLTHQFPEEPEVALRVSRTGLRFNSVAENVSMTDEANPAASSHAGLMHSPGHRANILAAGSNSIGVGVVRHGDTYWITEDFAHAFAALAAADLEEALLQQVRGVRRRLGLRELRKIPLAGGSRMACRKDADPRSIAAALPDARKVVLFTTWAADRMPDAMASAAREAGLEAMAIHVCPLDAGQFQVVTVFF